MAASPASLIETAAKHVLARLRERGELRYSDEFYDGSDEMHEALMRALGLDDDWYSAEGLIDLALCQLEEQGVVERDELDSKLADGEADFVIRWAEGGEHASMSDLRFRDME